MWQNKLKKELDKNSRYKHTYNEINSVDEENCSVFDYLVSRTVPQWTNLTEDWKKLKRRLTKWKTVRKNYPERQIENTEEEGLNKLNESPRRR